VTTAAVAEARVTDSDAVRRQASPLVRFGEPMARETASLQSFLFRSLYRHPRVVQTADRAGRVVQALFAAYLNAPNQMPAEHAAGADRERAVADYIAGMTDRFALREHHRLTGQQLFDWG
jgi:dGTPase